MQEQGAIYIELNVQPENGSIYVDSRHVPGLHLMGKAFQSMKPRLEVAIKRLFKDNQHMRVNVIWLTEFGVDAVVDVQQAFKTLAMIEEQQTAA